MLPPTLAFNTDGSCVDCSALRQAIQDDPELFSAVQADERVAEAVTGGDDAALQALLRELFQMEVQRIERFRSRMADRTIDAQRASATVPRDTVQLYKQLADAGLQYGPAFRLLRNVHVPDVSEPAASPPGEAS